MHVDAISNVTEARAEDLVNKTVLVIDVLRATSNIVTGLVNGCCGIIPVETIEQANEVWQSGDLLAGERNCTLIAGFDLSNSPFEYMSPMIQGKRIIMTTTNGTRALQKSQMADTIIACSLINAQACAKAAAKLNQDIILLCSGTNERFCLEDGLCAGLVIEELIKCCDTPPSINDLGMLLRACFAQQKDHITDALKECSTGKRLCSLGFWEDIQFCAQMNLYTLVPALQQGILVPLTVR
jgi:2-phosphosulfolactate phosphatase